MEFKSSSEYFEINFFCLQVKLNDNFINKKSITSHCYRIAYRSMERSRSQTRRLTIFRYMQQFSWSDFLMLSWFWIWSSIREAVKDKLKVGLRQKQLVLLLYHELNFASLYVKSIKKVFYLENAPFVSVLITFSCLRERKRSPLQLVLIISCNS